MKTDIINSRTVLNDDQKFIIDAIWKNCYKIAKVNVSDGRFQFFKKIISPEEENYLSAPNITEYVQRIIDGGWIYPEDAAAYKRMVQPENLRETVLKKRIAISDTFRRLIGDRYYWMTLETMIPEDFSEENPWVLFLWKDADAQAGMVTDSMRMLARLYFKIVRVNLTTGVFDVVKQNNAMGDEGESCGGSFIDCCWHMADSGIIHPDDRREFLKFFNVSNLSSCFSEACEEASCAFRRKFGEEYRWVKSYVYRSHDYSENNKVVLVYMRDVNERYMAELKHREELVYYAEHDELTGLGNRRRYNDDCARENDGADSAGAFFADLNGLKFINDNFGHANGDRYIVSFANTIKKLFGESSCYRISGDEFVVVFRNLSEEELSQNYAALCGAMEELSRIISWYGVGERIIASVGFAWQNNPETFEEVVDAAERDMYAKKAEYYQIHPDFKRSI
ncbi:MAG: GGDEF domain-containing protein [Candidatus Coproplasma sp.]